MLTARARRNLLTVEDMRRCARGRVPRMFFGYVDSGSWTESTKARNKGDFDRILLRQRVARDISGRSLASEMAGQAVSMPLAIAPTGMTGMLYPDGEIAAARAAVAAGIPFTLSTMSISPLEAVAEAVQAPIWFQLYCMRDREFVRRLIARARAVECSALVVTLDLQIVGQRHADIRNALSAPPKPSLTAAAQVLSRPRWCWRMLRARHRSFGNIQGHIPDIDNLKNMAEWTAAQFDPHLDWDAIRELRDLWPGKLILKGVIDPEDAEIAATTGADALIVSNHGGRQLDGALSSIAALPDIAAAVGDRIELHLDGGIRSGQDILKALALGARGVYIGRPFLYGLAVDGEAGVSRVLDILRNDLDLTMALCGETDIRKVTPDLLIR